MKPRFVLGLSIGLFSTLSASAQVTLNWSGGTTGGNANFTTAGNWLEATSPTANPLSDLVIANRNGTAAFPSLLTGGDYTIRSLSMDNAAGRFGTSGLRIGPTTASVSTATSTVSFGTPDITILSATNNATTTFWRFPTTIPDTASLFLNLNYTGKSTINVDGTSRMTFDGVPMIGTGGIIKVGDGRVFTGSSQTFAGGATITTGTWVTNASSIRNTVDNTLTSGPFGLGPITLNGGTVRSSSETGRSYHNNVVLAASSTLGGSVILDPLVGSVLTGTQTFTDTTSGSTSLAASVTLTSISNTVWNQVITATDDAYILTKAGTGTLTLGRDNSYAGGTDVTEGTLGYATAGALGSGPVTLREGSRFGGSEASIQPTNPIEILGNVGFGLGTFINFLGGDVDLNGATRSLNLTNSTVFSGVVSNGGIEVISASATRSLTLSGTNTYTGPTTVSGGRLIVNGSITSDVTTAAAGSVGGEGEITGSVIVNGGLIPGPTTTNTTGTLLVTGPITLNAGSTASFEILDASAVDHLNVTGTATLNGTVALVLLPGYVPADGDTFDLLDSPAPPTLGGSFAFSLPTLPSGLAWDTSGFASTGSVEIISSSPYETWAADYSLVGDDALANGDPDHDGFTNAQEFAFGTAPNASTGTLVTLTISGTDVLVTYIERNADVSYSVRSNTDLQPTWPVATGITYLGSVDQTGVPLGYTRKQFTAPIATKQFYRVESTTLF